MGMLVLSRRKEESIMIGDDIEVKIVGIRGRNIRLGIEAPGRVPVHRREVYTRMAGNPQVHGIADGARNST
jgi:carbon storage regulator